VGFCNEECYRTAERKKEALLQNRLDTKLVLHTKRLFCDAIIKFRCLKISDNFKKAYYVSDKTARFTVLSPAEYIKEKKNGKVPAVRGYIAGTFL
jgi:hypothetical protein